MLNSAVRRGAQLLGTRAAAAFPARSAAAAAVEQRGYAAGATAATPHPPSSEDFEHATGLELKELEAAAKGEVPLFEQDTQWLHAPLGTLANPVQVTSTLSSRIVGATDVDDDSIIHWGLVEEGKPPVQIGEEFFVLKKVGDGHAGHH